eukprot:scaffold3939_cov166-Amphora_coffeaeformis.AAC.9
MNAVSGAFVCVAAITVVPNVTVVAAVAFVDDVIFVPDGYSHIGHLNISMNNIPSMHMIDGVLQSSSNHLRRGFRECSGRRRSSALQAAIRSAQTYPSKNWAGIYQAVPEEWRENKDLRRSKIESTNRHCLPRLMTTSSVWDVKLCVNFHALSSGQTFASPKKQTHFAKHHPADVKGNLYSFNWDVQLGEHLVVRSRCLWLILILMFVVAKQNPMPKPAEYEERKAKKS